MTQVDAPHPRLQWKKFIEKLANLCLRRIWDAFACNRRFDVSSIPFHYQHSRGCGDKLGIGLSSFFDPSVLDKIRCGVHGCENRSSLENVEPRNLHYEWKKLW